MLKCTRKVAGWLWDRGWAEWGAGNLSVNVGEILLSRQENEKYENLLLLTTTSGSRMRLLMKKPENGLCLVNHSDGIKPEVIPLVQSGPNLSPTSELPSHVLIHQALHGARPEHKAVLHTHPAEIIALSQSAGFNSQDSFNQILGQVLPELSIYLPEGVAYIPFHEPGSGELAKASAESLQEFRVAVWEKHGIVATGPTLEEAFDAIDLVVKAAKVWMMVRK